MDEDIQYSFRHDGRRLREHAANWPYAGKACRQHSASGLAVTEQVIRYDEARAVEWRLRFENRGATHSPLLSRICPLDRVVVASPPSIPFRNGYEATGIAYTHFVLHYFHGSEAGADDFAPMRQRLGANGAQRFVLSANGGRSSNGHMPFFNLQTGAESGLFFAVGWSGQWQAHFDLLPGGGLRVRAGMEDGQFHLRPGEAVRTPSIVVMEWSGPLEESWNRWRRFLREHKSPDLAGQPCAPRTWANSWFTFDCGYGVHEQNQLETLDGAAKLGLEYFVIDAGWFDCPHPFWWDGVGNWERPRLDAFPNGFQPLFQRAKEKGIGFGVWFEFERAAVSSRVVKEHPEWVLGATQQHTRQAKTVEVEHTSCLLDLGRPEVQDWILGIIDDYAAQGMAWFRHDFNADPLEIWRHADAPNRLGMTEIRYVEGLYRIYDEIRRRHPALFIEGCASGGRRIDIETVARNHGYFATDQMCGTPEPMQAHIAGFNHILLPHWHHTVLRDQNAPTADTPKARYRFFSFLGGAPCLCFDTRKPAFAPELVRDWLDKFTAIRHLAEGDFYALTEYSLSRETWFAMQFHRPDLDQGLVAVFRRPDSPYASAKFPLRGLRPEAAYRFTSVLDEASFAGQGDDLRRGLTVKLASAPDVALLIYSQIKESP